MLNHRKNIKVSQIAILIADCHDNFFGEIRQSIHSRIWKPFQDAGYQIFYIRGTKPNASEVILNYISDKLRHTRFQFIQYFVNKLFEEKINKIKIKIINSNNDLVVDVPEGLRHLALKMLIGMKYLEEKGFKIVYRTTISSILSFDNFNKVLNSIDMDRVIYKGSKGEHNGIKFISGANTLIDSKAINILFDEINRINFGYLDDVAFSKILWPYIDEIDILSVSIGNTSELNYLGCEQASDIVHFRCRSYEKPRDDLKIMNYVCEYLGI